jgi:hypothetical protein
MAPGRTRYAFVSTQLRSSAHAAGGEFSARRPNQLDERMCHDDILGELPPGG